MDTERLQSGSVSPGKSGAGDAYDRSSYRRPHPRHRIPLIVFTTLMAAFVAQRALILFTMSGMFEGVSPGTLGQSLWVGLRFDLVIACMAVVPLLPVLIPAPPSVLSSKVFQYIVAGYVGLLASFVTLGLAADYFFFKEFGERLDYKVVQYLRYDYIYTTIWSDYPVIPVGIALVVVFLIAFIVVRRVGFDRTHGDGPFWKVLIASSVMVALLALGIRGTIGPKPINAGPAHFSQASVVSQLTLNGLFSLREAVISTMFKSVEASTHFKTIPTSEALVHARELIAQPQDRFLDHPDNPLLRVTDTGRPRKDYNVVLIVLESMSWHYIGAMDGERRLTPNLDRLIEQGILMDRCFAVGERTTRGFAGIVAGFPDLLGDSVTTRSQAVGNFMTIGSVLERRGYETMFIYGGQPHYDHRQSFLGDNGFTRFVWPDQFTSREFKAELGYSDGDLFRTAHDTLVNRKDDRPFLAVLLTLSFHRPYHIPPGVIDPPKPGTRHEHQRNAIFYTDHVIGEFMDRARASDYFDDTIFVFAADHSGGFREAPVDLADFRVPFLIYAPAILGNEGKRVSQVCSQTDIAPTIMSLLGGSYTHSFFGSSVLDRSHDRGMALIQPGDEDLIFIDHAQRAIHLPSNHGPAQLLHYKAPDTVEPFNEPVVVDHETLLNTLRHGAMALLQTAEYVFEKRSYVLPNDASRSSKPDARPEVPSSPAR